MPTIRDNAICIRHWDYSETSQTVAFFGREYGMLRGLAKGAKREKGKFSGGIDLLTRGEVVAIVKPGRDLATITEWALQQVYWPLRNRLDAHRRGLLCAELTYKMVTDQDPHPMLFDALVETLESFDTQANFDLELLRFLWAILRETGYQPELNHDAESGIELPTDAETLAFHPRAGGVVADTGETDRWRVRRETIDLLRQVSARTRVTSDDASIDRASRLLAAYIRTILDDEPTTMQMVFPNLMGP